MKKYIILLLVGIFAFANANPDIYTSVSKKIEIKKEKKEKVPIKLHWYGKAGINVGVTKGNINSYLLGEETPTTIGLDLNSGLYSFFRPSRPSKFYWGADINIGVNFVHLNNGIVDVYSGYNEWTSQNFWMPYVNLAPQLGLRKNLSNALDIDIHIEPAGLYVTTNPEYTINEERNYSHGTIIRPLYGFKKCDVYSKIGIGIWHKKMIYDISYRNPWFHFPGTITVGVGVQF